MDTSPLPATFRRSLAALLAVLLVASLGVLPRNAHAAVGDPVSGFTDVEPRSAHAPAIAAVAAAGVTSGCAPARFCPADRLTRAQMASLMARVLELTPVAANSFRDVSATSPHRSNINALAARGIVHGCNTSEFCPGRAVSRAQMASVVARAFGLQPTGAHPGFRDTHGSVHARAISALADAGVTLGCGDGRFCGNAPVTRAQFASLLFRAAEEQITTMAKENGKGGGKGLLKNPKEPIAEEPVVEEPIAEPTPEPIVEEPIAEPTPEPVVEEPVVEEPVTDPILVGALTRTSVGAPTPTGTLSYDAGTYRLSGAGTDIWNGSDSFEYAHRSVIGDTSVVVRVTEQSRTHGWAKAGLMVRSDTSPGSPHVSLFQTPDNGLSLQYRSSAGGATLDISGGAASPPTWLRLDRVGDTFTAYGSGDGTNWLQLGTIKVAVATTALVGLAVTSHLDGTLSNATFSGLTVGPVPASAPAPAPTTEPVTDAAATFLYSSADITRFRSMMAGGGPYFGTGDAGHGGIYSPGDGARSAKLANEFLANPQASYWIQTSLPYSSLDPWPNNMAYARPLHAAWVYMTLPDHPQREDLRREVKALLLHHATHASHDYANATNYPVNYPGSSPSPIFNTAHWMTRLIKARDMIGRDAFTTAENATLDRWFHDYANWSFKWIHVEQLGNKLPGREQRDYSKINMLANAHRKSYDGGPLIGSLAKAYTNRNAAVASAASLAANYLKAHGYTAPSSGGPSYGRFTVDQLLLHSQLFVEETIRFSVFPQGLQGDFERGDLSYHTNASPQTGWLYSVNVLANLVEITEYHAKRGDMSLWNYGTTAGFDGTAGVPVAGGFGKKNVHFFAWAMSRYVNDGWRRTNDGHPLALPHFYHDVIPAATVGRFAPTDTLIDDAWRRSGSNFPAFPQTPQSQGPWSAHLGEGAKAIGLIEQANGTALLPQ